MAPLVVHTHQGSPPGSAVSMLANLLELEMEPRQIDLKGKENKSEQFMKLNPMGTVPVLEDGDFIVSESHAILKYLLEKYGGEHRERLYPSEVRVCDTCLFFNAGVFFVRMKVVACRIAHKRNVPITSATLSANPCILIPATINIRRFTGTYAPSLEDIDLAYGVIEEYLQRHKFVAADHVTLADIALASTAAPMQAIRKIDAKRFPRCVEWLVRMDQEPWYHGPSVTCVTTFTAAMEASWKQNKQISD